MKKWLLAASIAFLGSTAAMDSLSESKLEAQAVNYDKAYAPKTLTVKASPGTSYKTLGKIKPGSAVKVYGGVSQGKDQYDWFEYQKYGWSKIKYKNKFAWVKTDDLHFVDPWNWVPGIKTKTINDIKKRTMNKNDKYKLEKSDGIYYVMYIKREGKGKWQYFITINCKTGWYHG